MAPTRLLRSHLDTRATVDPGNGFYVGFADGRVYGFGPSPALGEWSDPLLRAPVAGIARLFGEAGVVLVTSEGELWRRTLDSAVSLGLFPSSGEVAAVGVASVPKLPGGYWVAYSSGEVRPVGDAPDFGDASQESLVEPIVGIAATPTGGGYWLCGADGSVFSYGDAYFYGSLASVELEGPVISFAPAGQGDGYWLLASDGGVFCFGSARFHGSVVRRIGDRVPVGLVGLPDRHGYWVAINDGMVFALGNAAYLGSVAQGQFGSRAIGIC